MTTVPITIHISPEEIPVLTKFMQDVDIIAFLMEHRGSMSRTEWNELVPVYVCKGRPQVVDYLLHNGAKLIDGGYYRYNHKTVLDYPLSDDMMKVLLRALNEIPDNHVPERTLVLKAFNTETPLSDVHVNFLVKIYTIEWNFQTGFYGRAQIPRPKCSLVLSALEERGICFDTDAAVLVRQKDDRIKSLENTVSELRSVISEISIAISDNKSKE